MDQGSKFLVDFDDEKFQIISFDRLNNYSAYDVKLIKFVLDEKPSFKMFECLSLLN